MTTTPPRRPRYLGRTLQILLECDQRQYTFQLHDLSCYALGAKRPQPAPAEEFPLENGTEVGVWIRDKDIEVAAFRGRVGAVERTGALERVDINYLWSDEERMTLLKEARWYPCSDIVPVAAWTEDPFFFEEKIFFRLHKISRLGLWLVASGRNKSFMPGLVVPVTVQLPGVATTAIPVRLAHIGAACTKDRLEILARFERPNGLNNALLAEYLLLTGAARKRELDEQGLAVRRTRSLLEIRFVSTSREMERILRLRRSAATGAPPQSEATIEELRDFADSFDKHSRQAFAVMASELVGAARVIFPGRVLEHSELHEISINFPTWLRNNRFVEISRFILGPEVDKRNVFLFLLRHAARITLETGHSHLVAHVPPEVASVCTELGFELLKVEYRDILPNSEHRNLKKPLVFWLDINVALTRTNFSASRIWEIFYGNLQTATGRKPA